MERCGKPLLNQICHSSGSGYSFHFLSAPVTLFLSLNATGPWMLMASYFCQYVGALDSKSVPLILLIPM